MTVKHWDIQFSSVCFSHSVFSARTFAFIKKKVHAAHWHHAAQPHPSLTCILQSAVAVSVLLVIRPVSVSVLPGTYQSSCTECKPCPIGTFTTESNQEDRCDRCSADCRPGKETMSHLYSANCFIWPYQPVKIALTFNIFFSFQHLRF